MFVYWGRAFGSIVRQVLLQLKGLTVHEVFRELSGNIDPGNKRDEQSVGNTFESLHYHCLLQLNLIMRTGY